ncbi:MAG: hypothetical protein OEY81_04155 [Candidatus Bathyarchaeota archaeon]|nr:hypothetical protein [Candidatus Bathyarchaeota archaeon]
MTDSDAPAAKKESQAANKTSSETLEALLFAITDFAKALESAVVNLRQNLKELSKFPEEKPAEVYHQLPWEHREGSRGSFQTINKRSCGNSDLYRHLFNVVKVNTMNTGKFAHKIGEWLYWIDTRDTPTDPTAIYRRKKKQQNNETTR